VVSADWTRVPVGTRRVSIVITDAIGKRVAVQAVVRNPATPRRDRVPGFVESEGHVSIESEHYSRAVAAPAVRWQLIPDFGRTRSGVTAFPVTAPSRAPGADAPRLEYRMFLFDSSEVRVKAYVSPTLNFADSKDGLRYAVSFDDAAPQVVNVRADTTLRAWERSVAEYIVVPVSTHVLARPGEHILKFWMVDPGVVLQKLVVEARNVKPSYLGPPESYHRAIK